MNMCLLFRNYSWAKKAWVKIHTGAFVTSVGCNKLETEHLSKVAAGPGASQLWSAQETSTDGRWGSGFHFFNTVWANQIYGRTPSCQWANCGLMEKRMINIHREEGILKGVFPETIHLLYGKTFSVLPLPLVINNIILDCYENQMRKCFEVCCIIVKCCYYFYYISYHRI